MFWGVDGVQARQGCDWRDVGLFRWEPETAAEYETVSTGTTGHAES
jgi:hypothetical protein